MSGIFTLQDAKSIQQSTRFDLHWIFFKRQIQIQHAISDTNLTICEIGAGTGDIAQLSLIEFKKIIKKYICIEGSELAKNIKKRNLKKIQIINADIEKIKIPKCNVILAKYVFHHIENKKKVLESSYTALPKNGALVIIDRFPKFGIFSTLLEKIWNYLGIKKVLGKHHYISRKKFIDLAVKIGFEIEYQLIKNPMKIKNFFITKEFYVFRK